MNDSDQFGTKQQVSNAVTDTATEDVFFDLRTVLAVLFEHTLYTFYT